MFFRSRVVPQTPPSLVKFRSRDFGVITGAGSSVPSSDHVPELRNARAAAGEDGRHGRPGVVARRSDHGCAGKRGADVPLNLADDRARLDEARQQPGRNPQIRQQAGGPRPRLRIHELRRRRHGVFGGELPRHPVVQEVGDRAEPGGGVDELRRGAARGVELIQRVEGQELDAGDRVDLLPRHDLPDGFHDPVGTGIAIVVRVFEQVAVLAEERVVASPGVDADALERGAGGVVETAPDLEPQPEDVPLERSAVPDRLVGEPAHLVQGEGARVQPSEHRPSALRAEIDCEKVSSHVAQGRADTAYARTCETQKLREPCCVFRITQRAIGCRRAARPCLKSAGWKGQRSPALSGRAESLRTGRAVRPAFRYAIYTVHSVDTPDRRLNAVTPYSL